MSNGTQINRMWQLWTKISMMVLDGKRDPESVAKILQGILNSSVESSFPKMPNEFQVWKTIKLGTGIKDAAGFRKAISDAKMRIGNYADDILGKPAFKASDTEQDVDLVTMTVAELGFKGNATYKQICDKAIELGLELCPAEVGPQLRLQYTDQPMNEWVIVAMEAIADSNGSLSVFDVVRLGDGTWLYSNCGRPGYVWNAGRRFVFVRRK